MIPRRSPFHRLWLLTPATIALVLIHVAPADAGRFFRRPAPQPAPPAAPSCQGAAAPAPPPATLPEPGSEAAIRQVLDAQVAAWNRGDLDTFMAGYWQSAELTFFSGPDRTAGWQATLERYRKRYKSEGKEMGRLTFTDVSVEMLGPDSALVRGGWHLEMSKESPSGLFTLIFRRTPEGWRIVHDHTSR